MEDRLDIGDVARLTGLSVRALRFYEGRGIVAPLRSAGGRRIYGRGELARLNAAVALKQAGFSLAEIAALLKGRSIDIGRLIAARLAEIDKRARSLAEAAILLRTVQSRIDRGEPIDVATLCSLIRVGDTNMQAEWKAVTDRYMNDETKADFAAAEAMLPTDFDPRAYAARWQDLGSRIEAALPLDPASIEASRFHDEWQALLAPFRTVATPAMMAGTTRLYDRMREWQGEQSPPFAPSVWDFIKEVSAVRRSEAR